MSDVIKVQVAEASAPALRLSPESVWPHSLLHEEGGKARLKALCDALGLSVNWRYEHLGLPEQADWRFAGPGRWALCYGGCVAYEVASEHAREPRSRGHQAPVTVYTVDEVALALRVSVETIRRALRAGELSAAKLGRVYRITRADLDIYLRARGSQGLEHPAQP